MPIPMPPPPAPYVAPDLHPIVARSGARLTFLRNARGRVMDRSLDHSMWIAAEGAPLEVRFHKRADGTIWAEQATYVDGDRGFGFARIAAGARTDVISLRAVGGLGVIRNFVTFTIRSSTGTALRRWSTSVCTSGRRLARLDRDNSPADPTYPETWDPCGNGSPYALGRIAALDRGWSMPATETVGAINPLPSGRYTLEMNIDPIDALADSDRSNDVTSVPLVVANTRSRYTATRAGAIASNAARRTRHTYTHHNSHSEPEWYRSKLAHMELKAADVAPPMDPPANVDLPDLRSAPSYEIDTRRIVNRLGRRDLLDFGALEWNAGPGPLEVEAFREHGTTLDAFQVFYRDGERVARQARGTLIWHAAPGHNHFHFNSFALYRLTTLNGTVVRDSGKHSWCIVDTDDVDTTRPGAPSASAPTSSEYETCGTYPGSLWARLGMSVGSGDFYSGGVAGQSFDVTRLRNGRYLIRIEVNPLGVIAEADTTNNVSTREIVLGGRPGARTVVAKAVPTIDEDNVDFFGDEFDF